MLKVMTILGTRPEIIRLSCIIKKLDRLCEHTLVYTGQNYDPTLKDIFFQQLGVRQPDYSFSMRGNIGEQLAILFEQTWWILEIVKPERVLVLGDTNSSLALIVAKRYGATTLHMEAGNRCYDRNMPEEINRKIIDHASDILLPYTERSKLNLLAEGFPQNRIFVTGNPIYQIMQAFADDIEKTNVLSRFSLKKQQFFLATVHRANTVDDPTRLKDIFLAFHQIWESYHLPIIVSLHPRTKRNMVQFSLNPDLVGITLSEPLGFFEFSALEESARCILTDSGTVQEEGCIYRVPTVTLRLTTERPETIECGSNILGGFTPDGICRAVRIMLTQKLQWTPPQEYLEPDAASIVAKILLAAY